MNEWVKLFGDLLRNWEYFFICFILVKRIKQNVLPILLLAGIIFFIAFFILFFIRARQVPLRSTFVVLVLFIQGSSVKSIFSHILPIRQNCERQLIMGIARKLYATTLYYWGGRKYFFPWQMPLSWFTPSSSVKVECIFESVKSKTALKMSIINNFLCSLFSIWIFYLTWINKEYLGEHVTNILYVAGTCMTLLRNSFMTMLHFF